MAALDGLTVVALGQAIAALRADALVERLTNAGTAWARLNDVAGLSTHGQLRRAEVQTPSGAASLPASPLRQQGKLIRAEFR